MTYTICETYRIEAILSCKNGIMIDPQKWQCTYIRWNLFIPLLDGQHLRYTLSTIAFRFLMLHLASTNIVSYVLTKVEYQCIHQRMYHAKIISTRSTYYGINWITLVMLSYISVVAQIINRRYFKVTHNTARKNYLRIV